MSMKNILNWVLAAILVCGASVFTACTIDNADNPAQSNLNVAPSVLYIMGLQQPNEMTGKCLIKE